MNYDAAKDFMNWAKERPSGATVLVLIVVVVVIGLNEARHAKAGEMDELRSTVESLSEEVTNIKGDVKSGRVEAMESRLFEARVQQCKAATEDLKRVYAQRVSRLLSQYRDLTTKPIDLPECEDL